MARIEVRGAASLPPPFVDIQVYRYTYTDPYMVPTADRRHGDVTDMHRDVSQGVTPANDRELRSENSARTSSRGGDYRYEHGADMRCRGTFWPTAMILVAGSPRGRGIGTSTHRSITTKGSNRGEGSGEGTYPVSPCLLYTSPSPRD